MADRCELPSDRGYQGGEAPSDAGRLKVARGAMDGLRTARAAKPAGRRSEAPPTEDRARGQSGTAPRPPRTLSLDGALLDPAMKGFRRPGCGSICRSEVSG